MQKRERFRYCEVYDAIYDKEGNFVEKGCGILHCELCKNRPATHEKDCPCVAPGSPKIISFPARQ